MSFDFHAWMKKLDPFVEYEFRPLSGGLVNVIQRAKKTSAPGTGKFPSHASLILKYAPSFVAAVGEGLPFSQKRQVLENLSRREGMIELPQR